VDAAWWQSTVRPHQRQEQDTTQEALVSGQSTHSVPASVAKEVVCLGLAYLHEIMLVPTPNVRSD